MQRDYQEVGTIRQIYRYPVKSMAGELVHSASIGWYGLEGDRRYAFMKKDSVRGFPWLTMRDIPELVLFQAYHTKPESIGASEVRVKTPEGNDLSIMDPKLIKALEARSRYEAQLIHLSSGIYDALNLSIITSRTIRSLNAQITKAVDSRRFRANIIIDVVPNIEAEYPEDAWLNSWLIFGEGDNATRVRVNKKDSRCMAVNLDPDTAEQQPQILKHIVRQRKRLLGIYGSTEQPGNISIGDKVFLTDY